MTDTVKVELDVEYTRDCAVVFHVAAENLRMAVDGNISQDRLNGEELSEKILKVYKIQKELNEAVGEILKEEEADMFPSAQLGALPNLEYIAQISGGKIF